MLITIVSRSTVVVHARNVECIYPPRFSSGEATFALNFPTKARHSTARPITGSRPLVPSSPSPPATALIRVLILRCSCALLSNSSLWSLIGLQNVLAALILSPRHRKRMGTTHMSMLMRPGGRVRR